jgi:pyruvate kinase
MLDKKVKIIATLGPSSNTPELIHKLAEEGVDVFRINLSHAKHDEVVRVMEDIRKTEKELKRSLTIMGDLAGPKIRIGDVVEDTVLTNGDIVKIVSETVRGSHHTVSVNYPDIIRQLKKGAAVYIDDGRLQLEVIKEGKNEAEARVIVGGSLKPNKGFYAEGISLHLDGLSKKDQEDVRLMIEHQVDALAISFVQTGKDVQSVRDSLPKKSHIMLIAKIETAKSIENIDEIIAASDGVMVARGDLGLAVPIAEVPHLQKRLITLCLKASKPVITATQMLESMHHNPIPTRAEVTDVANAILDGTDAVMLSGETATGEFPIETVRTMVKIIRKAIPHVTSRFFNDEHPISNAVAGVVGEVADQIGSKVIVAFTQSGSNARRISRHRHHQLILAPSPVPETIRKLNFSWGVVPVLINQTVDFKNMRDQAREIIKDNPVISLEKDEPFVIVAGLPFGESGSTNMIFVEKA